MSTGCAKLSHHFTGIDIGLMPPLASSLPEVAWRADPGIIRIGEQVLPYQWPQHLEEQALNLWLTTQWSWALTERHRCAGPKRMRVEEVA